MSTITIGQRMTYRRYVDDPTTTEQDLHIRSGRIITVTGEPRKFDEDGSVMVPVRFDDGFEAEAFEEELT